MIRIGSLTTTKHTTRRRADIIDLADKEHSGKVFKVMTIGNSGEIRERPNGIGRNPPSWIGSYFAESSSKWFAAKAGRRGLLVHRLVEGADEAVRAAVAAFSNTIDGRGDEALPDVDATLSGEDCSGQE